MMHFICQKTFTDFPNIPHTIANIHLKYEYKNSKIKKAHPLNENKAILIFSVNYVRKTPQLLILLEFKISKLPWMALLRTFHDIFFRPSANFYLILVE